MNVANKYKVCAIVGDFENRKKGLTHYIFENINREVFDIFYICFPARDFELWKSLYSKKFDCFGFQVYLIPRNSFLRRILLISRIVKAENPDLIFSAAAGIEPMFLKITTGIPVVDSIHGIPGMPDDLALLKDKINGFNLLFKFKIRNLADRVIAVSKAVKDGLIKAGIREGKIKIIYNGVDFKYIQDRFNEEIEEASIPAKSKIILSVGRLSSEKGHHFLIEAFNIIRYKTDALIIIIGWGPEEKSLKDLVKTYSLNDRILFLGFKENPFKYMKKSSFLVLPSVSDALPSVLMEAAVCGLPVLATESGGAKEIINVIGHGLLVPRKNIQRLADSMLEMLDNPELLSRFSNNAVLNASRFDVRNTAYEYQKLWFSILNGGKI
jgi:glycosyltransferase involved in cell wall biosynthesis